MISFQRFIASSALLLSLPSVLAANATTSPSLARKPNVLFISIDDLRPELGCYGVAEIKTPNIDRLASRGTTFMRAYCQQALCAPSRASIMTGLRPASSGVTNLVTHVRYKNPEVVTMSQQFKNNGYHAQSFGKIYHPGLDDPMSWSVPAWFPPGPEYVSSSTTAQLAEKRKRLNADRYIPGAAPAETTDPVTGLGLKYQHPKAIAMGPSTEMPDVADEVLEDGQTTVRACDALRALKDKPFFLAVGFNRPHLPFVAPKKYWDLYDRSKIPLAPNQYTPKDAPKYAIHDVGEITSYWDITSTNSIPEAKQRELKHGYYASVSYVDALVGKLLDTLDELKLRDNTIIVLWGDHGYKLGEHSLWCKHDNFDVSTRVPLIISSPNQKQPGGKHWWEVELLDVYPTLLALAGLAPPPQKLQGTSLALSLDDAYAIVSNGAAYSEYPVRNGVMGYSLTTTRYRYTEWRSLKTNRLVGKELYDHEKDPGENVNVADVQPYSEVVRFMAQKLQKGWPEVFAAKPADPATSPTAAH